MSTIEHLEIERKFLVKEIPTDLSKFEKIDIEQKYISYLPEVRVRKANNKFYRTEKSVGNLVRTEFEIEITEDTYNFLLRTSNNGIIKKSRYRIPIGSGFIAELDIYKNIKCVNATVEVEFKNIIMARYFEVPEWFGEEVTYDPDYKNKNLIIR